MYNDPRSRRWFLGLGAAWSAAVVACRSRTTAPAPEPSMLGATVSPYGSRSKFEKAVRHVNQNTKVPLQEASSRTPLHDTYGIITPSSLHFERHHGGVPEIDPATHTLTIHGMVERPLVFTVEDLKRMPSVSRIHFLECSGNSGGEWRGGSGETETDVQRIHGLTSCSEWTGVPVTTLLRECGADPNATWVLAEGADACKLDRSIPMKKMLDDAMVVYAQNGEALRPEQGYPMRLLLPGFEGNSNVKWLRRLKVMNQPAMSREETSKYTDLMPDGTARQFTFDLEAKSIITRPSAGETLRGPGLYELTRAGLDRPRHHHAGRDHDRRRRDMDRRGAADASAAARAHALPLDVEVGRKRSAARVTLYGRHRVYAASPHGPHQDSRHQFPIPQQRHPDLEGRV